MADATELHPKYIVDASGVRTAVVLPIGEFEDLLEDLHDLAAIAERREEPRLAHAEVIAQLRKDGLLAD